MRLLIKNTTITDPNSPHHGKTKDIFIENGQLKTIAPANTLTEDGAQTIDGTGTLTTPGFMDMRAQFADPGFEYREDIISGTKAAAAGGFTGVAVLPTTFPPIHSKSEVEYVINRSKGQVTTVYPIGCITQHHEGKELAELYDMHSAGAIAFSDGNRTITDTGLMHRAMLYAKGFDGLLCVHAEDTGLSVGGQMNEGEVSTRLGMRGIPHLAEEIIVKRDIELARYNNTRLHFSHISTAGAVELIRKAKDEGLNITADVAIANLSWDDSVLEEYNSNYKLTPPLRILSDIVHLLQGLKDGVIDAICSDHSPQEIENKAVEYEFAAPGIISLQTFLPLLLKLEGQLSMDILLKAITSNPRKILGLKEVTLNEGQPANLTVIAPKEKWVLNKKTSFSKSINSPLWGQEMTGKILLTVNNTKIAGL